MFNSKFYCKYLNWTIPLSLEDPDMNNWWIQPSILLLNYYYEKKNMEHIKYRIQYYNAVLDNAQVDFRYMNL